MRRLRWQHIHGGCWIGQPDWKISLVRGKVSRHPRHDVQQRRLSRPDDSKHFPLSQDLPWNSTESGERGKINLSIFARVENFIKGLCAARGPRNRDFSSKN